MLVLGLLLAGLVLFVRPLPGILKARSTGVLVGRGHGAPRIDRAAEPDRFRALMRKRWSETIPGLVMMAIAIGWTLLNLIAAAATPAR